MQATIGAYWPELLPTALLAFALSLLIVATARFHGAISFDRRNGVQRAHDTPVPRVGGTAVLVAMLVAWISQTDAAVTLWWGLPAILVVGLGLAEDLTHATPVSIRLLGTMLAGLLFASGTGYAIHRVDLPVIDLALAATPVAILFTAFAVGGLCQAMNIIDGFHGLASGTGLVCLIGFAALAAHAGDQPLVLLALLLAAAVAGFFAINFPFGKVFLGDSGAYLLGFALAAIAVMLPARNTDVSPWASLLIVGYPVTETLFSMFRRQVLVGRKMARADTGHLHSLLYRNWVTGGGQRSGWLMRHGNATTGLVMLGVAAIPVCLATLRPDDTASCLMLFAAFAGFYVLLYVAIAQRGQTLQPVPSRLRPMSDT